MNWLWSNPTKIEIDINCVKKNLKNYIKPRSKVLVTYGLDHEFELVESNICYMDVLSVLNELQCIFKWEGGISENSEYSRLIEISNIVATEKPEFILAVGGQSVVDGTKFISCASHLPEGADAWDSLLIKGQFPDEYTPFGSVMTIPGCGSEWNSEFTISRYSIKGRMAKRNENVYPLFSFIDPQYSMSIPKNQLRDVLFESFVNIIDQCITPLYRPLTDEFFLDTMKELFNISSKILSNDEKISTIEYHERLIAASLFSSNFIFALGKETCWAIHTISYQLSTYYPINLASALSIIAPCFLDNQFSKRIPILAKAASKVFNVNDGFEEWKARCFISELRNFISLLKLPLKVSDCEDVKINDNDIEVVMGKVMDSVGNQNFGFRNQITSDDVKSILKKVIF